MSGRTRGAIMDDVERAAKAACGDRPLCAECHCTFDSFTEQCPYADTDRAFTCDGWLRIAAAYDQAEASLAPEDRWAAQ